MSTVTLGLIGAGNMAEAIARSAIDIGVLEPEQLAASDPLKDRRQTLAALGVAVFESNAEVIGRSDQILLAVKPQMMDRAVADLAAHGHAGHILISIVAGVRTVQLAEAIGRPSRIIRVMPNTPLMAGYGMAGVAMGAEAQPGDDELAMKLFSSGQSRAIRVGEADLDAITAVSGSGPAYVFYLAEAMQKAAADLGLAPHASLLVNQTILGAAKLLVSTSEDAAELRRKVTSPGGTTEVAIRHMDGNSTMDVMANAIKAACAKSKELGTE